MISRRSIVAGALTACTLLTSPAVACKAPRAKDRDGYRLVINHLFEAWWARDFAMFQQPFLHPKRKENPDVRPLFDSHFAKQERRFQGEILFNGASAIVQVIAPQGPDPEHAICGGHAIASLFLVTFFPGLDTPVIDEVKYIDADVLAEQEWTELPGALP